MRTTGAKDRCNTGAAAVEGKDAHAEETTRTESEWMTTAEAAGYAKMSKRALLEHVAGGRLRPDSRARPGFRQHRFLRSTIDAWLLGKEPHG